MGRRAAASTAGRSGAGRRWWTPLLVLLVLALLCGGVDRWALREARSKRLSARATAEAPSAAPTPAPAERPPARVTSPEPAPSSAPAPEPSLSRWLELPRAALRVYGDCRDVGTWPLKLQLRRANERLASPGLSGEEREAAEAEAELLRNLLSTSGIGWLVTACGVLGPSEAPEELLEERAD